MNIYQKLKSYALEQSSAREYITNYMDVQLEHIAKRLEEDFLITNRDGRTSATGKASRAGEVSR